MTLTLQILSAAVIGLWLILQILLLVAVKRGAMSESVYRYYRTRSTMIFFAVVVLIAFPPFLNMPVGAE